MSLNKHSRDTSRRPRVSPSSIYFLIRYTDGGSTNGLTNNHPSLRDVERLVLICVRYSINSRNLHMVRGKNRGRKVTSTDS